MARFMKNLESEVAQFQHLAESAGERGHIQVLKSKKSALIDLLGVATQGTLVLSRFQHVSQVDFPSHFFLGLEHHER